MGNFIDKTTGKPNDQIAMQQFGRAEAAHARDHSGGRGQAVLPGPEAA